jgi:(p)ppGpp synthase/HD superfamily hydrolase
VRAYRFVAIAHGGQPYKGPPDLPYIYHLSVVSMEVIAAMQVEAGLDGDLAIQCSLLHDVVEDHHATLEEIRAEFGERLAAGVCALTKNDNLDRSDRMADCLDRIQQQSREIWMVKLADRIANLQPPPKDWPPEKIAEYLLEAVEIHDKLGTASAFLARRLKAKIETYGSSLASKEPDLLPKR